MYLYSKVSCIICQQEFSIKGIHSHYRISHTEGGKEKHLENALKNPSDGKNMKQFSENAVREYMRNPKSCAQCKKHLSYNKKNQKFCDNSCAASFRNKNRLYKKKPVSNCHHCGEPTKSHKAKFCSIKCSGLASRKNITEKELRARNAAAQAKYRAKYGYLRAYDPSANVEAIKEIYANRPEGYEVDHIIPLSKGGKHHEDNLQYLTISENRKKGNSL